MTTIETKLKWSETEPDVAISTTQELTRELDKIAATCCADSPTIVTICAHDCEVGIGLGLAVSFVHIEHLTEPRRYYLTVGNRDAKEVVAFYLHGDHHTEISESNLIPLQLAREVVAAFLETGQRSSKVEWQQI